MSSSDRRSRGGLALKAAIGIAIVVGSFVGTLQLLDYISPQTIELQPTVWRTFGKASYEVRNGTIYMRGPNYIYIEMPCDANTGEVEFSAFVEHSGPANVQFVFYDSSGTTISEPIIADTSNVTNKPVELRASTPPAARKVRLLVYSPNDKEVVFKDPVLRVKPTTS